MKKSSCQIAIIGGGIVGIALARELSRRFKDIRLLEKESGPGQHTSGHNSGVIHSGFNARPGTLKARLCVEGNRLLRAYCRENGVPHAEIGTVVVASREADLPILEELRSRGEANGTPGLKILSAQELQRHEPYARGAGALISPSGAIVDPQALVQSLSGDAERQGVVLSYNRLVEDLRESTDGVTIICDQEEIHARQVINCAGLYADRLAHAMGVGRDYVIAPFRGEYFEVRPQKPWIRCMLYPVPNLEFPFLGIHLTPTMRGAVLVGPNASPAFSREGYRWHQISLRDLSEIVTHRGFWNALFKNKALSQMAWRELKHTASRAHFFKEAQRLATGFEQHDLEKTGYSGIRSQLIRSDGTLVEDLIIERTPRSIHVLNVVSPGMTCSLAFAERFSSNLNDDGEWQGPLG